MTEYEELSFAVRSLFLSVFSLNCKLEDSEMTPEEQEAINSIDIFEVIENFKEVVMNLLSFKQEYLTSDKAELVKRSEKFETLLQKLEAEVRGHIRIEHQLKLHIETNQSLSEDLEIQNSKHLSEIKELQERIKKFQSNKREKDLLDKIQSLEEILKRKDALVIKLENDIIDLKNSNKSDSEKALKKKPKTKEENLEGIKQRIGEKSVGLHRIQKMLLEKPKPARDRNKPARKSANESELSKNRIYELKITKLSSKTHARSTSENIRPHSVHKRPPSH